MDVGQFLSFISGYRKATKLPKTSQGKINEFLKRANEDIRDLIENATPALILLDTKVYTSACVDFAQELRDPNSSTRQFVANVNGVYRDSKDFEQELQTALSQYKPPVIDINKISGKIAIKSHSLSEFSSVVSKVFTSLNAKLAQYAPGIQSGDPTISGRARYSVTAAGRTIRTAFARLTPCKLKNPETVIQGFDASTQEVFLGATFSTLRSNVNPVLTPLVKTSFESVGIILADKSTEKSKINANTPKADINRAFNIGEIVVFGHTGAKTTDSQTGAVEILGFNSPWTQQLMLLAAQSTEPVNGTDLINGFVNTSGQVDYSIEFTKEVAGDIKTLMRGQLAVIVPMSVKLNREVLQGETAAADQITQNLFGTTYRKLRTSLIGRILDANNLRRLITGLTFSPSLLKSIESGIVETIKTGIFKKTRAKAKSPVVSVTKDNTINLNLNKQQSKKVKLPQAKLQSKSKKVTGTKLSGVAGEADVVSLQNLLNLNLVETVKRNMGDGSRRDILNLRSGRFAESVEVQRVSQSRQGMVTAFYTYMRNPYATFSQGGKQQYPRTRDPKLLISKSIRQIAQQLKIQQLRAVQV
jgi:hypothetical protein